MFVWEIIVRGWNAYIRNIEREYSRRPSLNQFIYLFRIPNLHQCCEETILKSLVCAEMWSESWFYQLYRQYCQVTCSSLHTLNRLPNIPHSYWLRLIAFTQSMKIPKFTNRYKFTFDFLVCRRDLSSPENCNYLNCCLSKTPPLVAFIFGTITNRNHIAENSPFMEVSLMLFPPLYCTTHTRVASNSKRAIFIQLYTNIITNQQMYCWFGIIRSVTMWPCARICAAAKKKRNRKRPSWKMETLWSLL